MKRKILGFLLKALSRAVLKRYRPIVVAITGSVGKTSTKEAVASVLASKFSVWKTRRNLNTDIGLCLTILGGENAKANIIGWFRNLTRALGLLLVRSPHYPEYLVLEMGADHPGDIRQFLGIVTPAVSVVTALGTVPVHVASYRDIEAVAREKQGIIAALKSDGCAVLNADDARVSAMRECTGAQVMTFGFSDAAIVRVVDYVCRGVSESEPGISFRIQHGGSSVPVRLQGVLGEPYAYACAAAAAVGIARGMNLVEIAQGLEGFTPEKGRMRIIPGVKQAVILDDSYNAAPAAMEAALHTLQCVKQGHRAVAVLGDMLELGEYSESAHCAVGKQAAAVCDALFFAGEAMKFAYREAERAGFNREHLYYGADAGSVSAPLLAFLEPGDVVLVKGSQGMRMERVIEQLMAEPGRAAELLVRQTKEWKKS